MLFISGCAELTKHADAIKPTAKLTGMNLKSIDFEKAELLFDFAVENKNPVTLDLAGLDYNLIIAEQSLISGVTAKGIKLKANSTSPVQVPVTLKFDDLKKLPGEIWGKDNFDYKLDTVINVMLPYIGNYAVPVTKTGQLPVPKLPNISIKGMSVESLSFTTANVIAQIEIDNPNAFELALSNLDYQLNINQQEWGHGKIAETRNIPKKGKTVIDIPLSLNLLSVGQTSYKMLLHKADMDYQLKGNVDVDTGIEMMKAIKLPLDVQGTTSLR
jgi:LEA14-like dessication related protein